MKNRAHALPSYTFSSKDALLCDANVWLFLYPAPTSGQSYLARQYSLAFKRMLAAKVHLAMDVLILSEYVNRYCRIAWTAAHKNTYPDYKKFRKSPAYLPVGQVAAAYSRRILSHCSRYDHPFICSDMDQVLVDLEQGSNDLNDGLIAETCRNYGWKLVTDDGDCTSGGIDVLTTNGKLLAACP